MDTNVTAAFQQHLAQRRANIYNMFKNPQDALGDEVAKAEDNDELDENEETEDDAEKGVKKGCGDGDKTIEKEDEDADAEDEDEKTDAEKAEIINIIGIEQLDAWKAQVDELAMDETMDETEKAEAVSAIEAELDEFAKVSDIQKSDILYALSGYESKIKFRKNGKEIKEQLNTSVIPALNADLSAAQNKADELLKECGAAPTHDVPEYWTGDLKINLAYKFYEWDETRVPETQSVGVVASFSPDSYQKRCCKNAPASQEEAEARCQYNEQIRKVANITTDIKACEIVSKNLKDNENIELTVRQLVAFKFA